MHDEACVEFLQWALPQLRMRWPGFRKVRAQVCKRLQRRLRELGIAEVADYRRYLATHDEEWRILDALTRVTISRFYRDKRMFAFLAETVLPELAGRALARGSDALRIWSAGCGAGEEPYTLAIVWRLQLKTRFPDLKLHIVATDADADMCRRAQQACYAYSSLKNLPSVWREQVFTRKDGQFCLAPEYRQACDFRVQDVREALPSGMFDLVLCRNLVFTYFDEALQRQLLTRMDRVLQPGGALVLGIHEQLPQEAAGFETWSERLRIFRKPA